MSTALSSGILFLIPTYLSEEHPDVLTHSGKEILFTLEHFIVENEKSARRFLKLVGSPVAQPNFKFHL